MVSGSWSFSLRIRGSSIKLANVSRLTPPALFAAVLALVVTSRSSSQPVSSLYQIGTWQSFRSAAITYTFDDNSPNQLSIAVPMFDHFGFKLTLFTVTSAQWGWKADWSGLRAAASEGHEIASHTVDHQLLGGMSEFQQQVELQSSRDTINARIPGQRCLTFAYPNCILGNSTLVAQYYVAARGCSGQIVSNDGGDFMNISSYVCGNQGLNTVADIESRANDAATTSGWCVYLIHGINGTEPGAYSPISQDTMRATLEYFDANRDKFWVAPFGTVARYIKERNSASVSEVSRHGDTISVQLTDGLDSSSYNIPLSVRRPLPNGWDSVIVRQHGDIISSRVIRIDTIRYVEFDAVPNAQMIAIVNTTGKPVGVVPGVLMPTLDFPETRDDWPFLWALNECVIDICADDMVLSRAVNDELGRIDAR